jgi:alpha-ribazole phosphatase
MMPVETTRFWLIRHALVDPEARKFLYGTQDVGICEDTMAAQTEAYAALGRRLPRAALWLVTPLSRTRRTAQAIFDAGYPEAPLTVEPELIEQSFGILQGTPGAHLAEKLKLPAHDFWPTAAAERPEEGESFDVCHGGVIRAAVAHSLGLGGEQALRLTIGNISLTRIERRGAARRVISVNETVEGVPAF